MKYYLDPKTGIMYRISDNIKFLTHDGLWKLTNIAIDQVKAIAIEVNPDFGSSVQLAYKFAHKYIHAQ